MSKLKSTKPICYRWYKILAGIAVCIICIVTWIFIVNPLLTWDKQFTANLIKKLSGSRNNEIIDLKDSAKIVKNLTDNDGKIIEKNNTIYNNSINEIKNNRSNINIQSDSTIPPFRTTTKKDSFKNSTFKTTKLPSKILFKTSTPKTPIFYHTKSWLSTSKIPHKSFNYTANENIFKMIISTTTQTPNFLENKNNYLDKKINNSKITDYLNQKSVYNKEKTLNIIRNGKLFEEPNKKKFVISDTTTTSTYSASQNNDRNFNDKTELLFSDNNMNNTLRIYNEVTQYPKIKNQLNNSDINKSIPKILYPQNEILFQTTLPPTTIEEDDEITTTYSYTTVTVDEKPLPITVTTSTLSTTTPIVTSTTRSQFFANEINFNDKNSKENVKMDKKKILKNNAPVIVTALLDIGRGEWQSFYRPFETYLNSFLDLLQMDNNMIIYGDKTVINFVRKHFKNKIDDKLLLEISMKNLPFYRYRDEMQDIIDNEQKNWNSSWDKRMKNHPESMYADYNILVNSKPYFLYNASIISPFASDIFIWIDAGYSHGDNKLIPKYTWDPFLIPNKVHIIKLTPNQDQISKYTYERVYRKDISVISAGFIGATRGVINRFYNFFYKTFIELLDDKKVDDDQTVILITIKNYASLFYVIHGGWFDAFRLLPNLDETFDKDELRLRYNPRLYRNMYPYWKIHNNSTRDKILN
uniref:Protein-serine/threonine phosphatase n=1 Tax=Strongyloides venezuelensis TaxID=75913 RepID=A0A0K0FL09_STRVS